MMKLILSYLLVQLTFPPILPTYLLAVAGVKVKWKGVSAGTVRAACILYLV